MNLGCLPDPKDARDYKGGCEAGRESYSVAAMPKWMDFRGRKWATW